ncbi:hypothetical protein [Mycolicibacterium porcinum]|uniref:hypothetical protein n=1 Tax=Mycolicibacterium porcinum TaxID=39693 RepID=UPI00104272F0|nr:hypothetical protein [Mycolicibacterium porcinum]
MANIKTVALEDGGQLIWPAGARTMPVGDHGLPERWTYKHPGGDDQPGCVLEFEVWDGVPVCARLELLAKADSRIQVRPKHLKDVAGMIDSVIEAAAVRFGMDEKGRTGWGRRSPGSANDQRARLHSVRASRRKITPAFLEQVASTYQAAPKPKLESVSAAFGCSERSAARYVTAAREAGLIDE